MFGIGSSELLIIGAIVVVLFGGKRLPQLGQNLGKAISELRKMNKGKTDENTLAQEEKTEPKGYLEKSDH
jgi:sec-independent protein translocase protein TatA